MGPGGEHPGAGLTGPSSHSLSHRPDGQAHRTSRRTRRNPQRAPGGCACGLAMKFKYSEAKYYSVLACLPRRIFKREGNDGPKMQLAGALQGARGWGSRQRGSWGGGWSRTGMRTACGRLEMRFRTSPEERHTGRGPTGRGDTGQGPREQAKKEGEEGGGGPRRRPP